jgi:hypothetical protein
MATPNGNGDVVVLDDLAALKILLREHEKLAELVMMMTDMAIEAHAWHDGPRLKPANLRHATGRTLRQSSQARDAALLTLGLKVAD